VNIKRNTQQGTNWIKKLKYWFIGVNHLVASVAEVTAGLDYVVQTPTHAQFISLVKSFKFTLKYTIISLLHVSVFNDHHQGVLPVAN